MWCHSLAISAGIVGSVILLVVVLAVVAIKVTGGKYP